MLDSEPLERFDASCDGRKGSRIPQFHPEWDRKSARFMIYSYM